jgi:hypothetical protein
MHNLSLRGKPNGSYEEKGQEEGSGQAQKAGREEEEVII